MNWFIVASALSKKKRQQPDAQKRLRENRDESRPAFSFRFIVFILLFILIVLLFSLWLAGCNVNHLPVKQPSLIIGGRGNDNGLFVKPRAIAINAKGNRIAVIDRAGNVQIFNAEGKLLKIWQLPEFTKGTPTGCSFDKDDNLVMADTHYNRILMYNLAGEKIMQFGEYGYENGGMVYPTDVVRDDDGNFYVTEYGELTWDRVLKYGPDGTFIKQWGRMGDAPGQFHRPMSITLGAGRIYVADSSNHRIQAFDMDGKFLLAFGGLGQQTGEMKFPYDIAVDSQGRIFVCEYGNNRIQAFDQAGNSIGLWGGFGHGPGQFTGPWGVAVTPKGKLVIADTNNHRVQIF
ncbi:SMP-30/gluconolactonase/LRE family protein [Candidatus Sumerlaeota bacterium]|nr:SMP-30/gluconolactonase/LRE family protein [Candidatus Sumerlaeota bacterium]